jgi:hypothetical protein
MRHTLLACLLATPAFAAQSSEEPAPGEGIPSSAFGPAWIETMAEVLEREAERTEPHSLPSKTRGDANGHWQIPSRRWSRTPRSGLHYATAKWGDTRMGIGFGREVELRGVWVGGHMDPASWTSGLSAVGYRDGAEVARTAWFEGLTEEPAWFAIDFEAVDRVVFEARPSHAGAGFYGLDDLNYATDEGEVVVDFEDLDWRAKLTGSNYAGLLWETGTGDFSRTPATVAHPPVSPPTEEQTPSLGASAVGPQTASAAVTLPSLVRVLDGPIQSDPGAGGVPDTMGAIGTTQFVVPLNFHLSVYDRTTEARLLNITLNAFFNTGETTGDPRVVFDHHENRWIVLASDWNSKLWFAYSLTDDAMGAWFKTTINVSIGSNAGAWPDYPTLGVDENGIYTAALMVGGSFTMSIFAFDKAGLLQATPTVDGTAWRQLPYEEAIQPAVTFGSGSGEYFVSRVNSNTARLRRVNPPLSAPTLTEVGLVTTQATSPAPNAPSMGAGVPIDTHSDRHMNAVYRNGSLWTAHAVGRNGRSAVSWYEFDAANATVVQQGHVEDPVNHYYVPTMAVNAAGDALLGFAASSASLFIGGWYTGRRASDPLNQMADEVEFAPGSGAFNQFGGTQRWGDYSMTSVDPLDDSTLWTIQQVAGAGNEWNMHMGEFAFAASCGVATSYCTAGTSAGGCQAVLSASGTPSATATSGFDLIAAGVEGQKDGLYFFAANGRQANAWGSGTSFQCVAPPVSRAGLLPGAGTNGSCDGAFRQDLNARWTAKPAQNPGAGALVQAQLWYRDPQNTSNRTTSLSDALEFALCP